MNPIELTDKLIAHVKQLKAEGKPIPKLVQDHLDAVGWKEAAPPVKIQLTENGRQELIAALYLLGASQTQLSHLFGGIRNQTISAYIKRKLTDEQRIAARRPGIWQPLISYERVSEYYQCYQDNKLRLIGKTPIELAMALRAQVTTADVLSSDPNLDEIE